MISTPELVRQAKEKQGIPSDYRLARILGVTDQTVSNWKSAKKVPAPEMALRLAHMAELDGDQVLTELQLERAATEAERDAWRRIAERLSRVAACVVAGVILAAGAMPENAHADNGLASSASGQRAIHYRAVRSWLKRAVRGLAYQLRQVLSLAESRNLREC